MNKSDLIVIRDYTPEDKNFVLATWLRGLYYGDSVYSNMKKQTFMENYHTILETVINNSAIQIKVACLKEDSNVILGYAVLANAPQTIHWVFVKKFWRNIGLARDLVPKDTNTVTNLTKIGLSILKKKDWAFNPFLV